MAVLVYKCLHGLTWSYLGDALHHPAESEFRRRLRSALSYKLSAPHTQLSAYGDQAFPVTTGSGTVFRSISHLLRHFLSSALTRRHTFRTLLPEISVVVPAN